MAKIEPVFRGLWRGDIGYLENVNPVDGEVTASFDGRAVTYGFGELDTVVPAYAATIHKSQGSEYSAMIKAAGGAGGAE
jgi:exodeoxyribonuclease V alpha subunit